MVGHQVYSSTWLENAKFIPKNKRERLVAIIKGKKSVKVQQWNNKTTKTTTYKVVETNNILSPKVGEMISEHSVRQLIDNNIQVKIV